MSATFITKGKESFRVNIFGSLAGVQQMWAIKNLIPVRGNLSTSKLLSFFLSCCVALHRFIIVVQHLAFCETNDGENKAFQNDKTITIKTLTTFGSTDILEGLFLVKSATRFIEISPQYSKSLEIVYRWFIEFGKILNLLLYAVGKYLITANIANIEQII